MGVTHSAMEWVKLMCEKNHPRLDSYTLGVIKRLTAMGYEVRFVEETK